MIRSNILKVLLAASLMIIATALAFEHIGGYKPCPLCLQERYAYYFAIAASIAGIGLDADGRPGMARAILAVISAGFLINAGLGAYHSGVEWGWWPGPTSCSGGLTPLGASGSLRDSLETSVVIRCDQAPWRLAGLSFAGWNAVLSSLLFAIGIRGAWSRL